jgi:hypothetical protein
VNPGGYGWEVRAGDYQEQNGRKFEFGCPPGGELGTVYGTGTYTNDSSVCSAAVHDGKLKRETGGQVVIEIRPGESSYKGSDQNGVTSADYEAWPASFIVASVAPFAGTEKPQTGGTGWNVKATALRGLNGQQFVFACPPAGTQGSLYGTETYTDDSSPCSAAVHVGKITLARGGRVIIEIKPGQTSYKGGSANGLNSSEYGEYDGSFSVVGTAEASPGPSPSPTG